MSLFPDPRLPLAEPRLEPVQSTIQGWAEKAGSRTAVSCGGRHWSYCELLDAATSVASRLVESSLRREVVAVTGRQDFFLIASVLGTFLGGGILLLLDPALPPERRRVMLREAKARGLISGTDAAADVCKGLDLTLDARELVRREGPSVPLPPVSGDDSAYVCFTSGTATGVPRGVLGTHKGLAHFLRWQRAAFDIGPEDRCPQITSLSFDVVYRSIFLPLTSGGTLCLPAEDEDAAPREGVRWLEREAVTVLHSVPSLAEVFLADLPSGFALKSLRYTFFAGEPLTGVLVRRWRDAFPATNVVNLYGPTETTLAKLFYRVPPDPGTGVQPVGWPLPNTQALVLSRDGRLCAPGERGEIAIRSPFRTLGYLNAPRDDAERFIRNPYRDDVDDLVYRTGDVGRLRDDGMLEILGRLDDEVKLNGVRIQPAEVAAVLRRHPDVGSCTVLPVAAHDGKALAAYVVPVRDRPPAEERLRAFLGERLPRVMTPRFFVFLDRLPLTVNGKVDRGALPRPSARGEGLHDGSEPSEAERVLAAIWAEVLGLESVAPNEHFFALGGTSLSVTSVVIRAAEAGLGLSPADVYEYPTVAALSSAGRIGRTARARPGPPEGATSRSPLTLAEAALRRRASGDIPVSSDEERFFAWWSERPLSAEGTLSSVLDVKGPLDASILEEAVNLAADRHGAVLRARFAYEDGRVQKRVASGVRLRMDLERLAPDGAGGGDSALHWAAERTRRRLDIRRRCMDVGLLSLGPRHYVLVLTFDHIVCDQASRRIFLNDVISAYKALAENRPSPLRKPRFDFLDYAYWERHSLSERDLSENLAFWKAHLAGASPIVCALQTDHPRETMERARGRGELSAAGRIPWALGAGTTAGLRRLASRRNTTLFTVIYCGVAWLLSEASRSPDVTVCNLSDLRNKVQGLDDLVGLLTKLGLLRLDLSGDPSFEEAVDLAHREVVGFMTRPEFPLIPLCFPEFNDMFRVEVNYITDVAPANWPGFEVRPISQAELDRGEAPLRTHIDLGFEITAALDGTVAGQLLYNADLWERKRAKDLATRLEGILQEVAARPDARLRLLEKPHVRLGDARPVTLGLEGHPRP